MVTNDAVIVEAPAQIVMSGLTRRNTPTISPARSSVAKVSRMFGTSCLSCEIKAARNGVARKVADSDSATSIAAE